MFKGMAKVVLGKAKSGRKADAGLTPGEELAEDTLAGASNVDDQTDMGPFAHGPSADQVPPPGSGPVAPVAGSPADVQAGMANFLSPDTNTNEPTPPVETAATSPAQPTDPAPRPRRQAEALSVTDLTVAFDGAIAVNHASFRVFEGESFGLVGESGSGKSTILRAITGMAPISAGRIMLEGKAIPSRRAPRDARAFARQLQMVFQDPYASLHPRHTVDRTLAEPLGLHGFDRIERRIEEVLERVGLGPAFRFRYPHQLSGGQRQRVAIARALSLEPRILLLDEPTSALDVSVQAEILNLLQDLRRDRGLTYVMVSHDLAVVGHMCDRIAVMKSGEILEELDVAALRAGRARTAYAQTLIEASSGTRLVDPANTAKG